MMGGVRVHIVGFVAVAAVLAAIAGACNKRPVYPEATLVKIILTNEIPEGRRVPELYRVVFFEEGGGQAAVSDFIGPEGGEVYVPAGRYDWLVCNFDLESASVEGLERFASVTAGLFRAPSDYGVEYSALAGSERSSMAVCYEPDAVYVSTGLLDVPHRSTLDSPLVVETCPEQIQRGAEIRIVGITGLKYVSSVRLYIDNLAADYSLVGRKPGTKPCVLFTDCRYDSSFGGPSGRFLFYGCCASVKAVEGVYVYAVLTDVAGNVYTTVADGTEAFTARDTDDVKLTILWELDIPEPEPDEDGFLPTLQDWENETVPVPIGQQE